jgi:TnpA family transposase
VLCLRHYTHVSDQFSAFSTCAISCSPREAIYVLDGLLENDTLLRPREHYTDTHGFTEQLFGLCDLLGIMNKVSALAVLSNAVLVWNTVRTTEILRALETTTGAPVAAMDIVRISPLAHTHVIPSGTYHFERATTSDDAARVS